MTPQSLLSLAPVTLLLLGCGGSPRRGSSPPQGEAPERAREAPAPAASSSAIAVRAEGAREAPASAAPGPHELTAAPIAEGARPLPRGTTVLHIGDSFAGALGKPLGEALKRAGVHSVLRFQSASYIPEWASPKMGVAALMKEVHPDLVIITLGGNELQMPDPKVRAEPIGRLIGFLGEVPCVWVAPTLSKHTGLLDVIQQNLGRCRYFDSSQRLPALPLMADGVHPTIAGRERWATEVLGWLAEERAGTEEQPWALRP